MNKKKFFATCTLVAFGATMVPAMAFAATEGTTTTGDGFTAFNAALTGAGFVVTGTKDDVWVGVEDTLSVKLIDGTDVTSNFELAGATAGDSGKNTASTFTVKAKANAILVPGVYEMTLTDKDNESQQVCIDMINAKFPSLSVTASAAQNAETKVIEGDLNTITLTGAIADVNHVIFDLGTDGFRKIEKGAKPVMKDDGTTPVAVLADKKLPVDKLVENHTYAVEAAANVVDSADKYPAAYFKYDSAVAEKVKRVADLANAQVNDDLAKIPDTITVEIPKTPGDIKFSEAGKALNAAVLKLFTNNEVFVDGDGSENITSEYDSVTDTYTDANNIVSANCTTIREAILVAGKDLEEEIYVVIKNGDTGVISGSKKVKVILTNEKTAQQSMAAYAEKYLDSYDAGDASSTTDDKGTLTVTKTGVVFPKVDGLTAVKATGNKNFRDLFNDNNIVALPEEDITGTVELTVKGGTITVTTTIKADGSSQPSDDEKVKEAAKAVNDSVSDFATVYAKVSGADSTDGAAISNAEWEELQAAYLKVITAYQTYSALL